MKFNKSPYHLSLNKGSIKNLKMMGSFLKPYRLAIIGALICLTLAAVTVLGLGKAVQALIDYGFVAGKEAFLNEALLTLVSISIILALTTYGRFFLVSWIGERIVADVRAVIYRHVLTLSAAFFEKTKTGDVLSRLTTDTTLLQSVIGSTISVALRNLLLLIGGFGMLAVTSLRLTGLVLIVVPVVIIPIIFLGRRVRHLSKKSQEKIGNLNIYANETIHEIRTVQAFTHEAEDNQKFQQLIKEAFHTAVQRIKWRSALTAIVIALIFGAVSIVLWIGGYAVLKGDLTTGELSAFIFYAIVVAGSVGALSEVGGDLQRAAGAAERLTDILAIKPEIASPLHPRYLTSPVKGKISFDHVSFSYPSRPDVLALKDVTLEINPGEKIALVGPSGSGKTTVFQLLLRFYDPRLGKILIDDLDIRDLTTHHLRQQIGLVSQDPVIFDMSVLENIRYGVPQATETQIHKAAEAAFAMEFIKKLPKGFETVLGERGVRLSGGQRQRLAIARALLRDPPLLLLDEATSSLDAESEQMIQRALVDLTKDRTTIIIAHRLSTVRQVDRILVVDQGEIVTQGTHRQLLQQGGLYARLAALQFQPALTL